MSNETSGKTEPKDLSPSQERRQQILTRYTKATSPLLSALALVFLVGYSIQSIWYEPGKSWFVALVIFGNVLWALFAIDVLFRFILAPAKRYFVRHNILDIVTVAIPQLRALRALRAFSPSGILSKKTGALTAGGAATGAFAALIVIWVGSLMVLNVERGAPKAEIVSMGDAVWWSFETITTVGYGDFVPVTWPGRTIAVFIMLIGISSLGVVTAALSAELVNRRHKASNPNADVLAELAQLKSMVASLQAQAGGAEPASRSPQ